ncbi:MAG: HAD family hydrolase [Thermoleophilia bacterium]|nr:HAD family hydrolase [Thermoleophilia bacterium]
MPQGRIRAITFDLWNTIYSADDGSLDPVRPRRREAMRRLLASVGVKPSPEQLQEAYSASFRAYLAAWEAGKHYGAKDQVYFFLRWFGVDEQSLPHETVEDTARQIEEAGYAANLKLLPGLRETVQELAASGYRLGVISDTSLTPGRVLRHFLEKDGILGCFTALSFSDEIGYPKPDRRIFVRTLEELGATPDEAAHVGDTPRTDIAGAKALGIVAIRCAAALDQTDPPPADHVIYDHREILQILEKLT